MDTISRENNSMLPVGGIIVGVLALLIAGYAAISLSKLNTRLTEQQAKLETVESAANAASTAASSASETSKKEVRALASSMQNVVEGMNTTIVEQGARITKIEEAAKKPAVVADKGKKGGGEVVAAPGEYIVKGGDTGMKIATANHVTVADLVAVNPGVNWNKLSPGTKVKLPVKK